MADKPNEKQWKAIIIVVACIVGLVSSQTDRFFGKGEDLGTMKADIRHNTEDIKNLDAKLDKIIDLLTQPK